VRVERRDFLGLAEGGPSGGQLPDTGGEIAMSNIFIEGHKLDSSFVQNLRAKSLQELGENRGLVLGI